MDRFIVKEWIAFSDMDLASAKFLRGMNPLPLEIICYLCQQSAEKVLKAYWLYSGEDPPRTHDLASLREKCETSDISFRDIFQECDRLNHYSSQPRYPSGLELTDGITELAIRDSEKIGNFVKARINHDEIAD
jgi:HEPN domain-containing protein